MADKKVMTDAEKIEMLIRRGKADFYFFCRYILGTMAGFDLIEEVPHHWMCDIAQKWVKQKKLILLPRDTFKTTVFVVSYAVWRIVNNPEISILLSSDKALNSEQSLSAIKDIFERHTLFRACFGNFVGDRSWSERQITVKTRTGSKRSPTVMVTGADSEKVGMHFDLIMFDDPHNRKNISTPEQILKIINYYQTLYPCLDSLTGQMQITATRWHHQDIHNHILTHEAGDWDVHIRAAEWTDEVTGEEKSFYPNRLTKDFLDKRKKELNSWFYSCTPAETPILMSDFTTKPISNLVPGDEVVGYVVGGNNKKRKLIKTKVLETNSRLSIVSSYTMESGRKLRCTRDHNWFNGRTETPERFKKNLRIRKIYQPAKVGDKIPFVYLPADKVNEFNVFDWGYLSGILDGEGACKYGSITIHQSLEKNRSVCEKIEKILKSLNLDFHRHIKGRDKKGEICTWVLNGGMETKLKFLQFCDLGKKSQILKNIWEHSASFVKEFDEVLDIKDDGFERVYALTTESGNYIAWGYASKNCQYLNNPTDDENASFKKEYFKQFTFDHDYIYVTQKDKLNDLKIPRASLSFFTLCDPAGRGSLTEQRRLDYTGQIVLGVDSRLNWYVFEAYRKRGLQPSDIIEDHIHLHKRYKPEVMGIESITYQGQIKAGLEMEFNKHGIFQPIKDLEHNGRAKFNRIKGLQPLYKAGKVYHAPGLFDLEMELLTWSPNSTVHDDLIDPLAYARDIVFTPDFEEAELAERVGGIHESTYLIDADMAWNRSGRRGTFKEFLEDFNQQEELQLMKEEEEEARELMSAIN